MLFLSLFLLIEVLLCAKLSQNVGVHKFRWFLLPVSFLFAWVCCQVHTDVSVPMSYMTLLSCCSAAGHQLILFNWMVVGCFLMSGG